MDPIFTQEPYASFLDQFPSERTKESYSSDLSLLGRFIGREAYLATRDDLRAFFAKRLKDGLSGSSLSRYKACYVAFFEYLSDMDRLNPKSPFFRQDDPSVAIKGKKTKFHLEKPDPSGLNKEERERLLASLVWDDTLQEKQVGIFVLLGLYTGMRRAEIKNLKWKDISLEHELVEWVGKRNKRREGYLPADLREHLEIYHALMMHDGLESKYVLFNRHDPSRPLCNSTFDRWCVALRQRAALKRLHPHLLRHSCAQWLIDEGYSVHEVKEVLGHDNIATTQRYFGKNKERLKAMLKKVMG